MISRWVFTLLLAAVAGIIALGIGQVALARESVIPDLAFASDRTR